MNNFVLVGRIVKFIELEKNKSCVITLGVSRPFKNDKGLYDTDFIDVILKNELATNTMKYCKKGDMIAIKGRIEKLSNNDMKLVADKLSFLSSNSDLIKRSEENE